MGLIADNGGKAERQKGMGDWEDPSNQLQCVHLAFGLVAVLLASSQAE